jgi:hypothetical protein
MENELKSEFGKGFVYNLILFAAHFERQIYEVGQRKDYPIWFNGASDHLYELTIPEKWQETEIGKIAKRIQDISLEIGHGSRMMSSENCEEDYNEVIKLTKKLGFLIDNELGVEPIKGEWE